MPNLLFLDMARGQQKIQSQQKNAKKQAGQKKKQGHDQKAAAKAALIYTCTVCRVRDPSDNAPPPRPAPTGRLSVTAVAVQDLSLQTRLTSDSDTCHPLPLLGLKAYAATARRCMFLSASQESVGKTEFRPLCRIKVHPWSLV